MYKIGELSKIVDIPVKTLRYYDDFGILKPVRIDEFTGYRFYDDSSILDCELIKMLKGVNFTLDEIKEYKNGNDSLDILFNKKEEIIEEIDFLNKKLERLSSMIDGSKNKDKNVKVYKKIPQESNNERVLRRKYERRNVRKYL